MKKLLVILIAVIGMAFMLYMAKMMEMSDMGIVLVMGLMLGALAVGVLWVLFSARDEADIVVKLKEDNNGNS